MGPNSKLQTPSSKLQIPNSKLQAPISEFNYFPSKISFSSRWQCAQYFACTGQASPRRNAVLAKVDSRWSIVDSKYCYGPWTMDHGPFAVELNKARGLLAVISRLALSSLAPTVGSHLMLSFLPLTDPGFCPELRNPILPALIVKTHANQKTHHCPCLRCSRPLNGFLWPDGNQGTCRSHHRPR
jgi:hypothetical protein